MWDRLHRLDRRWVFLLVAVTVLVPSLVLIPFPVPASNATLKAYQALESLEPGDFVILSFSYGPASLAELQPQAVALLRHAFRKRLRVMLLGLWPDAPPLMEAALKDAVTLPERADDPPQEGRDYVNVGYRQGSELVILNMAADIPGFFKEDVRGESLADLPVMRGIRGFGDVALVVDLATGDSVDWWVIYGHQRYGVPLVVGVTGVIVSQLYPYLNTGQLRGLLGGVVGAAEYESLIDRPGRGIQRVAILSFVHLLVIGLIVLGNLLYWHERRTRSESGGR